MANPLKHWKALLAERRKVVAELRHRLIAHRKAGDKAPRLTKAYERWKRLVAQAERGVAKAKRARHKLVMYDDVNVSLIPTDAKLIASYIDGARTADNLQQVQARFPAAKILTITVTGAHDADAGDIETGDMSPQSGARWARTMIGRGERPAVYANRSTMPSVIAELRRLGIARRDVRIWTADYTFFPHLPVFRWGASLTASDACQWTDKSHGRSLDESICVPSFLDR
jgi:hypothetical protein